MERQLCGSAATVEAIYTFDTEESILLEHVREGDWQDSPARNVYRFAENLQSELEVFQSARLQ
jgi:hypothetical protein